MKGWCRYCDARDVELKALEMCDVCYELGASEASSTLEPSRVFLTAVVSRAVRMLRPQPITINQTFADGLDPGAVARAFCESLERFRRSAGDVSGGVALGMKDVVVLRHMINVLAACFNPEAMSIVPYQFTDDEKAVMRRLGVEFKKADED